MGRALDDELKAGEVVLLSLLFQVAGSSSSGAWSMEHEGA
jgi:hypothetical protein